MKLTQDDAPSQPVAAGLRPFSSELSTRWERQKQAKAKWRQKKRAQAQAAGFKSAWEMRKTKHHAKHGYTPTASAEPATPLLDRLQGGSGPVRHIMRDGIRLID